jgi:hypothetical protein
MGRIETAGNCFLCGEELTKIKMKNHVIKSHLSGEKGEKVVLVKVEDAYDKRYWLLLDIAHNAELGDLDNFLRHIWLECCGHMSGFFPPVDNWNDDELGMGLKISRFGTGEKLLYRYDYGSTTTLLITMLADGLRPKQKEPVRLLARNVAPEIVCVVCGKPAVRFCPWCDYDHAMYCRECYDNHECPDKEYSLPITNSPRSCVCAYTGESDVWQFDPARTAE